MASRKEIEKHLKLALREIGPIKPWKDEEVDAWVFSHPSYPVEYGGETKREVVKNYPLYLREFIKQRLDRNLSPNTGKRTKGRGGIREGAGRPIGTKKEQKTRISLPKDIANWFGRPDSITEFRQMVAKGRE